MFATQPTALMDEMHVCILRVLAEDENKVLPLLIMHCDLGIARALGVEGWKLQGTWELHGIAWFEEGISCAWIHSCGTHVLLRHP